MKMMVIRTHPTKKLPYFDIQGRTNIISTTNIDVPVTNNGVYAMNLNFKQDGMVISESIFRNQCNQVCSGMESEIDAHYCY